MNGHPTSIREVRWERMFPDQLEAAFAARPLVWLAYGLCEPHGPQNAVGLDGLKAHAIACRCARTHGGIVAPPDWWHIHEIGGYAAWSESAVGRPPRSWLTCMPPWQHFRNICYHIRQVEVLGFEAAVLITGHYGPNWEDLKTLCGLIQPRVRVRLHSLPDFEANVPGYDGSGGDHAGKVETSLLWAVEPGCVDVTRFPAEAEAGPHFAMGRNAREANRRVGERMVDDEVAFLGRKADEIQAEYDAESPADPLRTFEDVERFWDDHIRPVFKDFRTMQPVFREGQEPPPEDSPWRVNWAVPDRA